MDGCLILPLIIIGYLTVLFIFQERKHSRERAQLMDRIMSRNFVEYITYDNERRKVEVEIKKKEDPRIRI